MLQQRGPLKSVSLLHAHAIVPSLDLHFPASFYQYIPLHGPGAPTNLCTLLDFKLFFLSRGGQLDELGRDLQFPCIIMSPHFPYYTHYTHIYELDSDLLITSCNYIIITTSREISNFTSDYSGLGFMRTLYVVKYTWFHTCLISGFKDHEIKFCLVEK